MDCAAGNLDVQGTAFRAAADACTESATVCSDVAAADCYAVCAALKTAADTCCSAGAAVCNDGAACDTDIGCACTVCYHAVSTADTCTETAAVCSDVTAADCYVRGFCAYICTYTFVIKITAAADARTGVTAGCNDGTACDENIICIITVTAADTRTAVTAGCVKCAASVNCQCARAAALLETGTAYT